MSTHVEPEHFITRQDNKNVIIFYLSEMYLSLILTLQDNNIIILSLNRQSQTNYTVIIIIIIFIFLFYGVV